MSYTKTTWQDGDIITTEKLNKIENGIAQASAGGGEETKAYFPLVVDTVSGKVTTSFDDIVDACEKGIPCACEVNNARQIYLGVGTLQSNGGGDARKITFNSFHFSVSGSSRMFTCNEYIISTDGSVTLNQGYIAASASPV